MSNKVTNYHMDLCMNKTYAIEDLYKMSGKLDHSYDGLTVTIDNFYENAEDLYDHLMGRQYPMWKYNSERQSPNGIEYNDCRIVDKTGRPCAGRVYDFKHSKFQDVPSSNCSNRTHGWTSCGCGLCCLIAICSRASVTHSK